MMGAWAVFLALAPLLGGVPAGRGLEVAPGDFGGRFAAAVAGKLAIPAAVERDARRFRFVFVAGFGNERIAGYFARNVAELRAHGVPRRAIRVIAPSSHRTIEENFDAVRDQFHEVAADGPEPLIVIAHSRGACDALAFALRDPEFVRARVHALYLVQGPFGGSGVADYLTGVGPALDRRMPPRHRLVAHVMGALEKLQIRRGRHGGLAGMAREASRGFWARMLAEHAGAIPIVGPRTFYVTSAARPPRLRPFRRAIALYLGTYFGPNDGMVALADQSLPGVGTVLAILDAGHTDLTNRFPSARAETRRLHRALIQCILLTACAPGPAADAEDLP